MRYTFANTVGLKVAIYCLMVRKSHSTTSEYIYFHWDFQN